MQEIEKMEEDSLLHKHDDRHRSVRGTNSCLACGASSDHSHPMCTECGTMYENNLNEGSCGCGTCDGCKKAFPDMLKANDSAGHKNNDYMTKPSLYKVAKYAQKLLAMIPDGHEMDDWQRTKIAQIADDISEVYHSLDYDKHKGNLQ